MGVALGSGKAIKGDAYGMEREPTFHFWNVGWVKALGRVLPRVRAHQGGYVRV